MRTARTATQAGLGAIALLGASAAAYGAAVASTWLRYGHAAERRRAEADPLLDLFMPGYEVAECHRIEIDAPAPLTFDALMNLDLDKSAVIRAIFRGRQVLLGADPGRATDHQNLVEMTKALGWVVLAEVPGHEIVMGAVTRPWQADVVFRSVPPHEFAAFNEPDYVKIVWTLGAGATGPDTSVARTETRAVATDAGARRKFRWYWARFSPGIVLIREIAQRLVKQDAERRARAAREQSSAGLSAPMAGRP